MKTKWDQVEILHCRSLDCKGMLLTHPHVYYYKCSDCLNYFDLETKWTQLDCNEVPTK